MELTTVERLKLLEILPPEGDILTLKILRKLRETLSFTEDELESIGARSEYACPFRGEVDGVLTRCENSGFFPVAPKCAEHDILMVPTGQTTMSLTPEVQTKVKEVHMGPQAMGLASEALRRLNENKQLTEVHISLYDKFFPPVGEIPE